LVYQDHVFDAYGAAGDRDATYFGLLGASGVEQIDPSTHRPTNTAYEFANDSESFHFGAAPLQTAADLLELRVAADAGRLYVLARTTDMTPSDRTALLLLADTTPGDREVEVPFGAGIHSTKADVAVLLAGGRALVSDLHTGRVTDLGASASVANPDGYVNAIEAAIPRSLAAPGGKV